MQYVVTVKLLNQRNMVPVSRTDTESIIGVVKEGFKFEGQEVSSVDRPVTVTDKWYKDRDRHYYWGGGVREILAMAEVETAVPVTAAPETAGPPLTAAVITGVKDWGFVDFKIDEVWKISKGKNIRVAVLDTGLNFNLNDFTDIQNVNWYDTLKNSANKQDCFETDVKGHGTNCTAILCGQGMTQFGVAPEIELIVIKTSDNTGQRTLPLAVKGLTKAIELNSDIISISFGVSKTPLNEGEIESLHQLVKTAYNKQITIVAAAGNSGGLPDLVTNYPASFPECLSIGGIDRSRKRSRFSSRSSFLDLMGPGENLFSLSNPVGPIHGTSFSTPFVAGAIAIIKSFSKANGRIITNIELFDILKRSADKNIPNYKVEDYGWGILDPLAALKLLTLI